MAQAAGGALADSIQHYLTWANVGLMIIILGAGLVLPALMRRLPGKTQAVAWVSGVALVAAGPVASARVDCSGRDRNVFVALVTSALPHVRSSHEERNWRASPLERASASSSSPGNPDQVAQLRGAGAGRNIVMMVLESTGANSLQPYGATADPMPHLTELAAGALVFENVYAVSPESIKGLFSVLCSTYPAFDTSPALWERVATPSLAQRLSEAGYRTALFHSGRFMYLGMESVVRHRGFQVLEDAGAIGGNVQSSFGVDEPATVKRALAWIDSLSPGQRFFLMYLPIAGHHPYATPEPGPFADNPEASQYRNALHYADDALGELWRGLRERDLTRQTLFIVFGDHGEAFGEHDGNFGHTQFLYEENVRVPWLIVAPELWQKSVRVSQVASLIDLAPTILDLLGLPIPGDYQGVSRLDAGERMALFYTDYSLPLVGLRDGCWKFTHELGSRRSQLFNLREDPGERLNLAQIHPERAGAYRDRLQRWSQAQKGHLRSFP
jgi:lipoteichoic acid synthase